MRRRRNKKRKKRFKKTRHSNLHHVYPRSRFLAGTGEFKIKVRIIDHRAWHKIFENFFPEEVIEKIKVYSADGIVNKKRFIENSIERLRDWRFLFRDIDNADAIIEIIKNYWMYPGVELIRGPDDKFNFKITNPLFKRR